MIDSKLSERRSLGGWRRRLAAGGGCALVAAGLWVPAATRAQGVPSAVVIGEVLSAQDGAAQGLSVQDSNAQDMGSYQGADFGAPDSSSRGNGSSRTNNNSNANGNSGTNSPSGSSGYNTNANRSDQAAGPVYRPDQADRPDQGGRTTEVRAPVFLRVRPPMPPPSEFERYVSDLAGKPVRRFGADLLLPEARDFTAPLTTSIPDDYRINPGDELIVGLTGSILANGLSLVVDPNGRIFLPRVGAVLVAGVPYRDLQATIARQVSRQYRDFHVSVAIARLHGITVYVTGFANTPGSYTVASTATVINAVLAAGGPAMGGSFRSIQVRRGDRVIADFDLYDFLLRGEKHSDVALQNGDTIFIAPAGAQLAVLGSVNKEAIYEARAHDTLNDILVDAGGANTVADLSRIHVLDPMSDSGWQQFTPQEALAQTARRGEVLRVLSAVGIAQPQERLQSLVTVSGEVNHPGRYFVKPGTPLDDVIATAGGLTADAYPFGAVFVRDSVRRQQQIALSKALDEMRTTLVVQPLVADSTRDVDFQARTAAINSLLTQLEARRVAGRLVMSLSPDASRVAGDFVVENNDSLYVPTRRLAVGVYGLVNSSADFRYVEGGRVSRYIAMAGGYSRFADKKHIFVVRANGTVLSGRSVANQRAEPGDAVFAPVDAGRGAFWTKLRDLLSLGFQSILTGAVAYSAVK